MILISSKNWFWKFLHAIDRIVARSLCWLILQARPLLGPSGICPFKIGCTQFAIIQLEQFSVPIALWHTSRRVMQCNPAWLWYHQN